MIHKKVLQIGKHVTNFYLVTNLQFSKEIETQNAKNQVESVVILYIFEYQISRFLPFPFPGSGTQFRTGIPGSDSGTGRSRKNVNELINYVESFLTIIETMYKQSMCNIENSCKMQMFAFNECCFRCKIVLNKCVFHYKVDFPQKISLYIISVPGHPISWALLNPSVSPFKISANGLVVESSNPAVRLYRYNTFTGEVC